LRILILGGTSEARRLAERLADDPNVTPVLSLAGRTRNPILPKIAHRVGGFGGVEGLIAYLKSESIDIVIDATHPFAEQMSAHAEAACRARAIPLALFTRPSWSRDAGDLWQEVETIDAAVHALGNEPRRVFVTVGRLQLPAFEAAPQHFYLIRSIDAPETVPSLPHHRIILARGPFAFDDERALLESERIDVVVTKNSGGEATYAKIEAARALGLPVILIRQPMRADVPTFYDLEDLLSFVAKRAHQEAPEPRGV
jgi:precorrin-6A/cobalt-precorrin-6A reductase